MKLEEFELYTKSLDSYTALDVKEMEFMTDEELDDYQLELERDSGNLSEWDHCRAVLTFRKKVVEIERLNVKLQIIEKHCRNCDADERAIQPYEVLDIIKENN